MNMRSYSCCSTSPDTTESFASLAGLLKLMSSESRLRLLCILQDGGEHCVCELAEHVPDMSQSLISHHLSDLKKAGITIANKRGLRVYYRLSDEGIRVVPTILALRNTRDELGRDKSKQQPSACCQKSSINSATVRAIKEASV